MGYRQKVSSSIQYDLKNLQPGFPCRHCLFVFQDFRKKILDMEFLESLGEKCTGAAHKALSFNELKKSAP